MKRNLNDPLNFEDLYHVTVQEAGSLFGDLTTGRLKLALDDFNAVITGRKPIHAKLDLKKPRMTDGGTSYYAGDGYQLTIVMSLNGMMNEDEYVSGYIYGPIIAFEESVMRGNFPNIHSLAFYPEMLLRQSLKK